MHNFVFSGHPPTYNSWKSKWSPARKAAYKMNIASCLSTYHPGITPSASDLYGVVYHFFNNEVRIDADNLSKPMWDTLNGVLFLDDYQVKLRVAGSFDLQKHDLTVLDLSKVGGQVIVDLLDAFDNEDHVIYVECGNLNFSHWKFNLEI